MMLTDQLAHVAKGIRGLSIDAIEAANSGHPGLPLGCADIAAVLYGHTMRFYPQDPLWINRDRFVLSAGHGSMLLYACLHLAGYAVSLDEIKRFRQYGAHTAGHPEFGELPGIETTTGPLGQGVATGIGMALAQKMAASQYKLDGLLDNKVFILAGDGCVMEGVTAEASSFAGHLGLNNVVVIYDDNDVCLDGPTSDCFSEDVAKRYEAYGWDVVRVDGHNMAQLITVFDGIRSAQTKPVLVMAKTVIGKGAAGVEGTCEVHGKALGPDELQKAKSFWGIPESPLFDVPSEARAYFEAYNVTQRDAYLAWQTQFKVWQDSYPTLAVQLQDALDKTVPATMTQALSALDLSGSMATRAASGKLLQVLAKEVPYLVGGSADLSGSDNTMMKSLGVISSADMSARNIKYGVREFAMAAISSGLVLSGYFKSFCGTFLTFSDYMRNAIRLAALMKLPVIYQFTHDSIFLGEDGPTHQPVEHVAALRAIPGLTVIRPADANEVKGAWLMAMSMTTPVALILSRQALPLLDQSRVEGVALGAYVVYRESRARVDYCILATGSEVSLAIQVAEALDKLGKSIRVVSMPSWELFERQEATYRTRIIAGDIHRYASIEAGISQGWHRYIGRDGIAIAIDEFGLSAPAKELATHFGFTVDRIVSVLQRHDSN